MFTNEMLFRNTCPLIEDYHIKSIVGALERKQWVFGGRVVLDGTGQANPTILTLSSGIISKLDHYDVIVQQINAAIVEETYVDSKTNTSFRILGDPNQTISVIVLGTEPIPLKSQRKWAKDYCPFCKSQNFLAIVGSALKDLALFSFTHTLSKGTDTVLFANEMTIRNLTGISSGQQLAGSLVTQMVDDLYQIIITKSTELGPPIIVPPYPTNLNEIGFDLVGDAGETYDVLILGQITY